LFLKMVPSGKNLRVRPEKKKKRECVKRRRFMGPQEAGGVMIYANKEKRGTKIFWGRRRVLHAADSPRISWKKASW